jgi:hypothetical protein
MKLQKYIYTVGPGYDWRGPIAVAQNVRIQVTVSRLK